MSIPPVPPSNPDGTEPGQQPAPGTGPKAPQYGQNAPQYGQNAPQYGQNAPQYGQNAPQQGQNAPQYGQSQYGQSPYAQYPSSQPQGPGGVPKLVNTAFWLLVASGALWVLSLL
ncbi:MAG: hypothetical protein JWN05_3384, partial [Arthrobacter sp.]|nr:hypothetical protein [Arthrobacter sp.]